MGFFVFHYIYHYMKIIITESQYNLLIESKTNKFKKFLKNHFEIDLNGKIKEINRYSEIPKLFAEKYLSFSNFLKCESLILLVLIESLLANGSTQKFVAQRYQTTEANLHNWLKKNHLMTAQQRNRT